MDMVRLICGVFCMLVLIACGGTQEQKTEGLQVVCTTGMIGDLAANIAGNRANVTALMGPGLDPHYYKATQGDLAKLSTADIIFYNGLFLEGKMEGIFEKMARSKTVVPISGHVPESRLRKPPGSQGEHDPHIWFDVALWAQTIDTVVEVLSKVDPMGKDLFLENGIQYKKELMQLEFEMNMQLKGIEVQGRKTEVTDKEDRKDERTKLQATQQSELINQRQNDLPPKNFESSGNDILSGDFNLGSFGPR